ncbi:MAG: methyltransferase domain-containing protein [Gudongella sp.]|nr:methyltransferase domain-containing protein [Gudongella sp.]
MSHDKINKFENKERLEELRPVETLKRAGFKDGMVLCDIGAGTGVFSIPATQISTSDIYALEKSDSMIEILETKIVDNGLKNLKVKKVDSDILPMEDNICDLVIMITVLHHIDNKELMMDEIKRILKKSGRLMVIEFHKNGTQSGPPAEMRISQEELEDFGKINKLKIIEKFVLGNNFYGFVFEV